MPDALRVDADSNGFTLKLSWAEEDWPNDLGYKWASLYTVGILVVHLLSLERR